MNRIPRVVVAKVGLDGHDRGAKVVARALRDAGFEVIYTGLRRSPEEVVEIALQEDADVIAVSILSGAHMTLIPRILNLLKERNAEDILVIAGGTIPEDDAVQLKQMGVRGVYPPGTLIEEFINDLRRMLGLSTPVGGAPNPV
ncbi:Methylmalonyl-CoA mutase [bacterium HR15]|nr:Methylmalonyl-CoA mutase [bacterium HR15]